MRVFSSGIALKQIDTNPSVTYISYYLEHKTVMAAQQNSPQSQKQGRVPEYNASRNI
jgi:hypothetical protein